MAGISAVFKKAWQAAREAVKKYGGKFKKAWQAARESVKKYGGKASDKNVLSDEHGKTASKDTLAKEVIVEQKESDAHGKTVSKDTLAKALSEVIVEEKDLPYLKWDEWHLAFKTLYHALEDESKLADSSNSFLILNFADDDFDIDIKKYKGWQETKLFKKNRVIAELKDAWKTINGKEVTYLPDVDYFVYMGPYEILKNAGYSDQDIVNAAEK